MALQIKELNGTIYLEGKLNACTYTACFNQLNRSLINNGFLTIDIDGLDFIDWNGTQMFKELYQSTRLKNLDFYITGRGCKEMTDEIRFYPAA